MGAKRTTRKTRAAGRKTKDLAARKGRDVKGGATNAKPRLNTVTFTATVSSP
jgi:hypothetical protein